MPNDIQRQPPLCADCRVPLRPHDFPQNSVVLCQHCMEVEAEKMPFEPLPEGVPFGELRMREITRPVYWTKVADGEFPPALSKNKGAYLERILDAVNLAWEAGVLTERGDVALRSALILQELIDSGELREDQEPRPLLVTAMPRHRPGLKE